VILACRCLHAAGVMVVLGQVSVTAWKGLVVVRFISIPVEHLWIEKFVLRSPGTLRLVLVSDIYYIRLRENWGLCTKIRIPF